MEPFLVDGDLLSQLERMREPHERSGTQVLKRVLKAHLRMEDDLYEAGTILARLIPAVDDDRT